MSFYILKTMKILCEFYNNAKKFENVENVYIVFVADKMYQILSGHFL